MLRQVLAGNEIIFNDGNDCLVGIPSQRAAQFDLPIFFYMSSIVNQENKIKEYLLVLLRNCLSYDFIGTSIDESSEDVGSLQVHTYIPRSSARKGSLGFHDNLAKVPTAWRSMIEDSEFVDTFFECYKRFVPPSSSQVNFYLVS
jgi:hypothetical protein